MGWLAQVFFPSFCVGCKKPGPYLCPSCLIQKKPYQPQRCLYCHQTSIYGATHLSCQHNIKVDGTLSIYYYRWPLANLVKEIKYRHRVKALYFLLDSIHPSEWKGVEDLVSNLPKPIISYIPLSKKEKNQRGFNQAEVIAQYLAKKTRLPLKALLVKNKESKKQSMLHIKQRRQNLKNVFKFKQVDLRKKQSVIMVDDIITSGTTLNEAAKIIKTKEQIKIFGFSLFRAN